MGGQQRKLIQRETTGNGLNGATTLNISGVTELRVSAESVQVLLRPAV